MFPHLDQLKGLVVLNGKPVAISSDYHAFDLNEFYYEKYLHVRTNSDLRTLKLALFEDPPEVKTEAVHSGSSSVVFKVIITCMVLLFLLVLIIGGVFVTYSQKVSEWTTTETTPVSMDSELTTVDSNYISNNIEKFSTSCKMTDTSQTNH